MKYSIFLSILLLILSCKNEPKAPKGDWLMFSQGSVDRPNPYFLLTKTDLFKGKWIGLHDQWPTTFEDMPLSEAKFQLALPLADLPIELTAIPDSSFGCPGCLDSGFWFIRWKKGDKIVTWTIDPPAAPSFMDDYLVKMDSVVSQL